jgi:hypothetical protein
VSAAGPTAAIGERRDRCAQARFDLVRDGYGQSMNDGDQATESRLHAEALMARQLNGHDLVAELLAERRAAAAADDDDERSSG